MQHCNKTLNTRIVAPGAIAITQTRNAALLANSKNMVNGVWKRVYPRVFGGSRQLSPNKFFDPSTPSMRKGCDG